MANQRKNKGSGERIRQEAAGAAETVREQAQEQYESARETAKEAAGQARAKVSEFGEQARERGEDYFEQGKRQAVTHVDHVCSAIHAAAEQLREDEHSVVADYVDAAADQIRRLEDYLQQADMNAVCDQARGFVRRRPEIVIGGLFVAGVFAARFIKASRSHHDHDHDHDAGGSFGGASYEAYGSYGEAGGRPVGATQNQPYGTYEPFQSRGMTSPTTADPTEPEPDPGTAPGVPRSGMGDEPTPGGPNSLRP